MTNFPTLHMIFHVINEKILLVCSFIMVCSFIKQVRVPARQHCQNGLNRQWCLVNSPRTAMHTVQNFKVLNNFISLRFIHLIWVEYNMNIHNFTTKGTKIQFLTHFLLIPAGKTYAKLILLKKFHFYHKMNFRRR